MGNTYFKDSFAVSLFEEEREGLKGLSSQIANFLNEDKYNSSSVRLKVEENQLIMTIGVVIFVIRLCKQLIYRSFVERGYA